MSLISFEEFSKLSKKKPTEKLIPGKHYYIQDDRIEQNSNIYRHTTVWTGTYVKKNDDRDMFYFKNVEPLVDPFGSAGKPHGFGKTSYIYGNYWNNTN